MASENVLEETKKLLEMMSESEERVSLLYDDINKKENLHMQIKISLKELREGYIKSLAILEYNQHLKENIKKYNRDFVDFAQQMYSCIQELYSNLKSDYAINASKELYKISKKLETDFNKYKETKKILIEDLKDLSSKEEESKRKKELEMKETNLEHEELQKELDVSNEKLEYFNNYVKCEMEALNREDNYETIIKKLQESIMSNEGEINELNCLIPLRHKSMQERQVAVPQLENQIEDIQTEIKTIISNIDRQDILITETLKKVEILERIGTQREVEYVNCENELNNLEKNMEDLEDDNNNTIIREEKITVENYEAYSQAEKAKELLKEDQRIFKKKIEHQQEQIEKLLEFLEKHKKIDVDLNTEIEIKENEGKQLKSTYQQMKADYQKRLLELEAQLTIAQEAIETAEDVNRKLQTDTDNCILELNQLKNKSEQQVVEEKEQFDRIQEMDKQISRLKNEIAQAKTYEAEKLKRRKNPDNFNVTSSSLLTDIQSQAQHWDSDSSTEEGRKRFSELMLEKMKVKQHCKK